MQIQADFLNRTKNVDSITTAQDTPSTVSKRDTIAGYALDISGTVMDNSAYRGQGKTTEEVMQEAGQQDVTLQRNYMAVMSNSMSTEDFSKLQEEGYHPGETDVETVVTIVDRIKATLAEAGVEVRGYTDTLDAKTLATILGTARASAVYNAMSEAGKLTELTDSAKQYMIQNELKPTIENLYKAQYSNSIPEGKQGKGYYADDVNGYYSKKADTIQWESVMPQIERTIQNAGYEVTDETTEDAKWLIEKGLPLTTETFESLKELQSLTLPVNEDQVLHNIQIALSNGQKANEADLFDQKNFIQEAKRIKEEVIAITEEEIETAVNKKGSILTIADITSAHFLQTKTADKDATLLLISAKRQMHEIQLQMSVEANLYMLKKGFSIETEPLERVLQTLQETEAQIKESLFGDNYEVKERLYTETINKTSAIAKMPIQVVGEVQKNFETTTLNEIHEKGVLTQTKLAKASESYEELMTSPRRDLGDSIQKAFRNTEELLQEIQMTVDKENARAVRILGYNQMEITSENIESVKAADTRLQSLIEKMTPAKTLQMIRAGVNPLTTSMVDLEQTLDSFDALENEAEKYSKYLYKLEQSNEITAEEKEAYIGVYRLLRQVEKTDGAALGSLIKQGSEVTFSHLLTAVRSAKKTGADYTVDDSFGGIEASGDRSNTITAQISNYYNRLSTQIADKMSELTSEQEMDYLKEDLSQVQDFEKLEDYIYKTLLEYQQPVTIDNVVAMQSLMQDKGAMITDLKEYAKKTDTEVGSQLEEALDSVTDKITEHFTDKENAGKAYENLLQIAKELTESITETTQNDVQNIKALSTLYKQVFLATNLASQENYEIPVQLGDELTSINIKFLQGTEDKGKVSASVYTEEYGSIVAEFRLDENRVTGYVACNRTESYETIKKLETPFTERMTQESLSVDKIHFTTSKNINPATFGLEEKEDTRDVSNQELYKVAKAFIISIAKVTEGSR